MDNPTGRDRDQLLELMELLNLSEEYGNQLNPYVHQQYTELWREIVLKHRREMRKEERMREKEEKEREKQIASEQEQLEQQQEKIEEEDSKEMEDLEKGEGSATRKKRTRQSRKKKKTEGIDEDNPSKEEG